VNEWFVRLVRWQLRADRVWDARLEMVRSLDAGLS
jgi:hypothetical protein